MDVVPPPVFTLYIWPFVNRNNAEVLVVLLHLLPTADFADAFEDDYLRWSLNRLKIVLQDKKPALSLCNSRDSQHIRVRRCS
jgi:hypothetical protein